jgi:hypothetical protein
MEGMFNTIPWLFRTSHVNPPAASASLGLSGVSLGHGVAQVDIDEGFCGFRLAHRRVLGHHGRLSNRPLSM